MTCLTTLVTWKWLGCLDVLAPPLYSWVQCWLMGPLKRTGKICWHSSMSSPKDFHGRRPWPLTPWPWKPNHFVDIVCIMYCAISLSLIFCTASSFYIQQTPAELCPPALCYVWWRLKTALELQLVENKQTNNATNEQTTQQSINLLGFQGYGVKCRGHASTTMEIFWTQQILNRWMSTNFSGSF